MITAQSLPIRLLVVIILSLLTPLGLGYSQQDDNRAQLPRNYNELNSIARRIESVVQNTQSAVVGVEVRVVRSGIPLQMSGSGTIISPDGYVVSAAHVVVGQESRCTIVLSDGSEYPADVLGVNSGVDYALLKVHGVDNLPYVEMGQSHTILPGEWVVVMGHPLGIEKIPFRPPVVRAGRVTRLTANRMHTDAPLISGDSGGAVMNMDGKLVGINVSINILDATSNHFTPIQHVKDNFEILAAGINITNSSLQIQTRLSEMSRLVAAHISEQKYDDALSVVQNMIEIDPTRPSIHYQWATVLLARNASGDISEAFTLLNQAVDLGWSDWSKLINDSAFESVRSHEEFEELVIKLYRKLDFPARLGLRVQPHQISSLGGLVVNAVTGGSPAHKAGLKTGDKLTHADGQFLQLSDELYGIIRNKRAGDNVTIRYVRGDERVSVDIRLHGLPTPRSSVQSHEYRSGLGVRRVVSVGLGDASTYVFPIKQDRAIKVYGVSVRSDGWILTKLSEIEDGKNISITVNDIEKFGRIVARNTAMDLALIKIDAQSLPIVRFAGSDRESTVGSMVSSFDHTYESIGVGFISMVNYLARNINQTPVVGMEGRPLTPEEMDSLGVDGIRVTSVITNYPAHRAGMRRGDVIVSVDGYFFNDWKLYVDHVYRKNPGDKVQFVILRNDEYQHIEVELGHQIGMEHPMRNSDVGRRILGPYNARYNGFGEVVAHDTVLSPNQMGTPLVDLSGKVVGINIARFHRSLTYAIPANRIVEILPQLFEDGEAFLRMQPQDF